MASEAAFSTGPLCLSDSEINKAAHDTVTLCGRIILAIVAKEGVQLPSITATHFDLSTLGISREGYRNKLQQQVALPSLSEPVCGNERAAAIKKEKKPLRWLPKLCRSPSWFCHCPSGMADGDFRSYLILKRQATAGHAR